MERGTDGFYYISGRTKEMYRSCGENLYTAKAERVLATHPYITDIAVIDFPGDHWGVGLAVIVPTPGIEATL